MRVRKYHVARFNYDQAPETHKARLLVEARRKGYSQDANPHFLYHLHNGDLFLVLVFSDPDEAEKFCMRIEWELDEVVEKLVPGNPLQYACCIDYYLRQGSIRESGMLLGDLVERNTESQLGNLHWLLGDSFGSIIWHHQVFLLAKSAGLEESLARDLSRDLNKCRLKANALLWDLRLFDQSLYEILESKKLDGGFSTPLLADAITMGASTRSV